MNSNIQLVIITIIIFNIILLHNCVVGIEDFKVRRCFENKKLSIILESELPSFKQFSDIKYNKLKIEEKATSLNIHDNEEEYEVTEDNVAYNFDQPFLNWIQKGIQDTIKFLDGYNENNIPTYLERNSKFIEIKTKEYVVFHAFAPDNFLNIRILNNISIKFKKSFMESSFIEIEDPRNKKPNLYYTKDMQFVMNIISKKEQNVLISILPELFSHYCKHKNSLLPKIVGLYYIQFLHVEKYVIVMQNDFPNQLQKGIDLQYYLKGTNKETPKKIKKELSFRLLDADFLSDFQNPLVVPSSYYNSLKKILENDCEFLKRLNIINYSLLLNVRIQNTTQSSKSISEQNTSSLEKNTVMVNYKNSTLLLYIRINNILQNYDFLRKLERTMKTNVCNLGDGVTVQEPNKYAERFLTFIFSNVFSAK